MTTAHTDESTLWYSNTAARSWTRTGEPTDTILNFHRSFVPYNMPTKLIELPSLAFELNVSRVFVKDESTRMGLPAFKILGASWGVFYTLCQRWNLDVNTTTVDLLRKRAAEEEGGPIELVAATAGNHGRAVARMAKILNIHSRIYVPETTTQRSYNYIASEGAEVIVVPGNYEAALEFSKKAVQEGAPKAIHMQDVAWSEYESVPTQIANGYSTLFQEIDEQLAQANSPPASLVAIPVGCGVLGQAGVRYYRNTERKNPAPAVLTVEPDNAACLLHSLKAGKLLSIDTGKNIMPGMTGEQISFLSWPDLHNGVDAAITVNDTIVNKAVHDLASLNVSSGPCGASTLAALRTLRSGADSGKYPGLDIGKDAIIVLVSTEGNLTYLGEDKQ
ncbi:diaminopropionate ammonia-lyase [Umbelopsis sp. PMI_123]|nr:diaminopropionate ammonia-lyase [Umbelopsis sp. PMI_123]